MTKEQIDYLIKSIEVLDRRLNLKPAKIRIVNKRLFSVKSNEDVPIAGYFPPFSRLLIYLLWKGILDTVDQTFKDLKSASWTLLLKNKGAYMRRRIRWMIESLQENFYCFFARADSYVVVRNNTLVIENNLIFSLAAHEVRHRVQFKKAFSKRVLDAESIGINLETTRSAIRNHLLTFEFYRKSSETMEQEIDAVLVQALVEIRIGKKKLSSLSEMEYFAKKNSSLILDRYA